MPNSRYSSGILRRIVFVTTVYVIFFYCATFQFHNDLRHDQNSESLDTELEIKEVEHEDGKDLYQAHGYNASLSNHLPLGRPITELRHLKCQGKSYTTVLPTASLIIPFHNELLKTLLRTAVSCQNRAPKKLLKEIILVDDFSDHADVKQGLDKALKSLHNIQVVRLPKREGLVRARMAGARQATSEILVMMDSHCECNEEWLQPLLDPIAHNYRTVTCPYIDVIDKKTFEVRAQDEGARGSFDWNSFHYKRLPVTKEALANPDKPFESPVMAGGLFAVSKRWFSELGGYDEGLDVWGGEQYEFSFKVWMCGGRMLDTPCSRVAHIYRDFMPYKPPPEAGDFIQRNYKRVAEVWMDDFKEVLYKRNNPDYYKSLDAGDISKQKALRQKLGCKSFHWYLKTVAYDQNEHYPAVEPEPAARGMLKNGDLCISLDFQQKRPVLGPCQTGLEETDIQLTYKKDIRPQHREQCLDGQAGQEEVVLYPCHSLQGNQRWSYDTDAQQVVHAATGRCLTAQGSNQLVILRACIRKAPEQKWTWSHVHKVLAEQDAKDEAIRKPKPLS